MRADGSRRRGLPDAHAWAHDACRRCGIRRREEWVLDRGGEPVLALVWTGRSGDFRVQPFPPMRGLAPEEAPGQTLEQAFPGVPVGGEPPCRAR